MAMMHRKSRPADIYAMLSPPNPTSTLRGAARELSKAVDDGYLNEPKATLSQILELISTRASIDQLPYVKISLSDQLSLVNALTDCLDPEKVKFKSCNDDAHIRLLALNALIEIHDISDDANTYAADSLGAVGRAIPNIIAGDVLNDQLIKAYHDRLIGWPPFMDQYGGDYEKAFEELYPKLFKRGHCDEMAMGVVRDAQRELRTMKFMRSMVSRSRHTAG